MASGLTPHPTGPAMRGALPPRAAMSTVATHGPGPGVHRDEGPSARVAGPGRRAGVVDTRARDAGLNLLEQFRDPAVIAARDAFADGQVVRRRGRSAVELLAEWDHAEPELLARLRCEPADPAALPFGFDVVLVTDLCIHADDVALAIGRPPHRVPSSPRTAGSSFASWPAAAAVPRSAASSGRVTRRRI